MLFVKRFVEEQASSLSDTTSNNGVSAQTQEWKLSPSGEVVCNVVLHLFGCISGLIILHYREYVMLKILRVFKFCFGERFDEVVTFLISVRTRIRKEFEQLEARVQNASTTVPNSARSIEIETYEDVWRYSKRPIWMWFLFIFPYRKFLKWRRARQVAEIPG